jgi:hypothetical protein
MRKQQQKMKWGKSTLNILEELETKFGIGAVESGEVV